MKNSVYLAQETTQPSKGMVFYRKSEKPAIDLASILPIEIMASPEHDQAFRFDDVTL